MPSEQLQRIIDFLRANRPELPPTMEEARASFELVARLFQPAPDVSFEAVDAGGVPAEWIRPPGHAADAALVYLHGGAYTVGSVDTHRNLATHLGRAAGVPVLSVGYRLAPEHRFPAAIEDVQSAYGWLLAQGVVAAGRVALAGDSAGGGLTVATLLALRDGGEPLPAAGMLLSPWLDLAGTGESMRTRTDADPMLDPARMEEVAAYYLGGQDPTTPLASPLYADLAGLPPLLIHVGDAEILLDDARRFARRAEQAGVDVTLEVWDEMIHVWQFFAGLVPEADDAVAKIGAWLRQHLGT